jgi:uncharacterized protein
LQSAERTLKAFDSSMANNPAACASLCHALSEFLEPPTLVIVRGETEKMMPWKDLSNQYYYPNHLFFFLDETLKDLPQTLQRNFTKDVNAWLCQGVVCLASIDNLQAYSKTLNSKKL